MPEVSVIMPNYNGERFIAQAIESVIAQTHQDWELLICDDCSTDQSIAIIESYAAREPRIRLLHNAKNLGAAGCRNEAMHHARGEYLAFLDSDDAWYPQKLTVQIEYMRSRGIDISYMAYDIMDEDGKKLSLVTPPAMMDYQAMLKGRRINTLTVAVKRAIMPNFPLMPVVEDTALWLYMFRTGHVAHGILTPLSIYRLRKSSLSSRKLTMAKAFWHLLRDQEKLPLPACCYYFSLYTLHMLKKYAAILPEILRLR